MGSWPGRVRPLLPHREPRPSGVGRSERSHVLGVPVWPSPPGAGPRPGLKCGVSTKRLQHPLAWFGGCGFFYSCPWRRHPWCRLPHRRHVRLAHTVVGAAVAVSERRLHGPRGMHVCVVLFAVCVVLCTFLHLMHLT
jgi:hypothetical protein